MKNVGAFEAKTHLSQLLEQVLAGESIAITKRGVPVAMLVPMPDGQKDIAQAVKEFRTWRKGISLGPDLTLSEAIEEGRK